MVAAIQAASACSSAASSRVTTFHGLGLRILREHHEAAGLSPRFTVADEAVALQVATEVTGSERDGRKLLGRAELRRALADRDLVDFDGLVELAAAVLRDDPAAGRGSAWTSTRTSTRPSTGCSG